MTAEPVPTIEEIRRSQELRRPAPAVDLDDFDDLDDFGLDDRAIPAPRRRPERERATGQRRRPRVAPPAPVAAPRAPFVALVLTLVAGGIVGLLVLSTVTNANSFKLDALRQQQTALDAQEQQLNQQIADYEAPGNLQAAATRLGLIPAGTPAFIQLPDGQVLGVPQPARPGGRSPSGR